MSLESGLSLLEVMVTITILTLTSYLVGSAFPVVRQQQALTQAQQLFTAALRSAQTQALDESRHPDCLSRVGSSLREQKLCSDVGVYADANQMITFADIEDNNRFDEGDMKLSTSALPATVTIAAPTSLLFEATPPNVTSYFNGIQILPAQPATVTLRAPSQQHSFTVTSYGVVE